jgi:hypothetical protein
MLCAALIVIGYRNPPRVFNVPALLMPIAGMLGLAYGAAKHKLNSLFALCDAEHT